MCDETGYERPPLNSNRGSTNRSAKQGTEQRMLRVLVTRTDVKLHMHLTYAHLSTKAPSF